jgi:hypothetical protein
MKTQISIAVLAVAMLTGCAVTDTVLAAVRNFAVGVYRSTPEQAQVADSRATTEYNRMTPAQKQSMKDKGTRYLAVRTNDPTPAQMAEIKKDMKKPRSRYGSGSSAPKKVYCVMIWDTYSKEVVGNQCYAAVKLPQQNEIARFETYTAQYVGTF